MTMKMTVKPYLFLDLFRERSVLANRTLGLDLTLTRPGLTINQSVSPSHLGLAPAASLQKNYRAPLSERVKVPTLKIACVVSAEQIIL